MLLGDGFHSAGQHYGLCKAGRCCADSSTGDGEVGLWRALEEKEPTFVRLEQTWELSLEGAVSED